MANSPAEIIRKFIEKETPTVDNSPPVTDVKPVTPFRVLHVGLPFYSDAACTQEAQDARLIIIQCEDPIETLREPEPLPTTRTYQVGQIVQWGFNNKTLWPECWYRNPETGEIKRAFTQSVEFVGKVYLGSE